MVSEHIKTGALGEELAVRYLESNGYTIKDRNYWKKWGEIDIVAEKDNHIHFVEVKATRQTEPERGDRAGEFAPEDHVDARKQKRMTRAVQSYLAQKRISQAFQLDVFAVTIYPDKKQAEVKVIENVIFE